MTTNLSNESARSKTPIGEAWVETGVLWHCIHPETLVSEEVALATVKALAEFVGGMSLPAVVDIRGVQFADRAARDVFAREMDHERATAIVVEGKVSRTLGNAYFRFSRPDRPTKMFTSQEEAQLWALSFVD